MCTLDTIFSKNFFFAHENMKKLSLKVAHNSLHWIFPLLPWTAHMAKNWKSISEIGLRQPLLYLFCDRHWVVTSKFENSWNQSQIGKKSMYIKFLKKSIYQFCNQLQYIFWVHTTFLVSYFVYLRPAWMKATATMFPGSLDPLKLPLLYYAFPTPLKKFVKVFLILKQIPTFVFCIPYFVYLHILEFEFQLGNSK